MWYVLLVKRAHDLNISSRITTIYWLTVCIVPILLVIIKIFFPIGDFLSTIISWILSLCSLAVGIACFFIKWTVGDNIYGTDPLSSTVSSVSPMLVHPNFKKYLGIKLLCLLVIVGWAVYISIRVATNMIVWQFKYNPADLIDETTSSINTGVIQTGTLLMHEDLEENILLAQAKEKPFFPHYTFSRGSIYYDDEFLSGSDSQTFTVFDSVFGSDYAFDKNHLYYEGKIIGDSDLKSPLITDMDYVYHAGHIYYNGINMSGTDPQTFTILDRYAFDKNHVYYENTIVDADVASFLELHDSNSEYDAYDTTHKYHHGDIVLDSNGCLALKSVVQKRFDLLNDPNYKCTADENCDAVPVGNTLIDIFYSNTDKTCYLWEKYSIESVTHYEINPIQSDGSWYKYMSDSIFSKTCVTQDSFLLSIDEGLTGQDLEDSKKESVCEYVWPILEKDMQDKIQTLN